MEKIKDYYDELLGPLPKKWEGKTTKDDGRSKKQKAFQNKAEKKKNREIDACIRKGMKDKSTQGGERMKMGGK